MTKHPQDVGNAAPQESDAGAPASEVTPEMIEAGLAIFSEYCQEAFLGDVHDVQMIQKIYREMEARRVRADA